MKYPAILLLFIYTSIATGQVQPADGDSLHYRIIGFEVPDSKTAKAYLLEVFDIEQPGQPIISQEHTTNKMIAILPSFDKGYTWRVKYLKKNKTVDSTQLYKLAIRHNPYADTTVTKLRIIHQMQGHEELFVFLDNTRTLYDRNGEPVWFIPPIPGITTNNYQVRDLKLTPRNTITFLSADAYACEIDFFGNVLWRAPDDGSISGDKIEYYHHELTRLNNGNYLVAGNEYYDHPWPTGLDTSVKQNRKVFAVGDKLYTKVEGGTIIIYDSTGKAKWYWKSSAYFKEYDLFTRMPDSSILTDSHMNAVFFDEENNMLYASFRDMSRVIKISYPSGEVLCEYGCNYPSNSSNIKGDGLFYGQHACRLDAAGNLLLYNNNVAKRRITDTGTKRASAILLLKEPKNGNEDLQALWLYSCDIDTFAEHITYQGGNVVELPTGDYLACMGTAGRVFIVSKDKKLLWNAVLEKRDIRKQFIPPLYRVSPVYRQQLEEMVFR